MGPDQVRVSSLLRQTIRLLCKNGLQFERNLRIQGLLAITTDEENVFVVQIDENIQARENQIFKTREECRKFSSPPLDQDKASEESNQIERFRKKPTNSFESNENNRIIFIKSEFESNEHKNHHNPFLPSAPSSQPSNILAINNFSQQENFEWRNQFPNQILNVENNSRFMETSYKTSTSDPFNFLPISGQTLKKNSNKIKNKNYINNQFLSNNISRRRNNIKTVVCQYPGCGKTFCHRCHLYRHQRLKHGRRLGVVTQVSFVCQEPDCEKVFYRSSSLINHSLHVHSKIISLNKFQPTNKMDEFIPPLSDPNHTFLNSHPPSQIQEENWNEDEIDEDEDEDEKKNNDPSFNQFT